MAVFATYRAMQSRTQPGIGRVFERYGNRRSEAILARNFFDANGNRHKKRKERAKETNEEGPNQVAELHKRSKNQNRKRGHL
jgi:hypothetical protein